MSFGFDTKARVRRGVEAHEFEVQTVAINQGLIPCIGLCASHSSEKLLIFLRNRLGAQTVLTDRELGCLYLGLHVTYGITSKFFFYLVHIKDTFLAGDTLAAIDLDRFKPRFQTVAILCAS